MFNIVQVYNTWGAESMYFGEDTRGMSGRLILTSRYCAERVLRLRFLMLKRSGYIAVMLCLPRLRRVDDGV